MTIFDEPIPAPAKVPALKPLLEHKDDAAFIAQLLESLNNANNLAKPAAEGGKGLLDGGLYEALPLPGMNGRWPTTFDEYLTYLTVYVRWIPHQSTDPAWVNPTAPAPFVGEHREVYDYLCWFYWLIDQPLASLGGNVLQSIDWFAEFLTQWAIAWGDFLDTTESFNDDILKLWIKESPRYRIKEDSMIGDPPRSNSPSGWLTFNQFFARELNPGVRPITNLTDNTTVVVPADCTFKRHFDIDETGRIQPPICIKGTHTYGTVQQLLHKSDYADAFNGGHFIHLFLGPYSYHRFHTPVAGIVKECYPVVGRVYLQVALYKGQFNAADSATDGYQFQQARGVLTVDTAGSGSGDVGVVAVLPIGMCQVSGVNMTHEFPVACDKGDEFGYFTFGGSDIIILLQKGTNPQWNSEFTPETEYYSHYGTNLATVAKLSG